ncbi:CGL28 [Auxenochlorella protothecoides x Auxenochlorella symbiontica]
MPSVGADSIETLLSMRSSLEGPPSPQFHLPTSYPGLQTHASPSLTAPDPLETYSCPNLNSFLEVGPLYSSLGSISGAGGQALDGLQAPSATPSWNDTQGQVLAQALRNILLLKNWSLNTSGSEVTAAPHPPSRQVATLQPSAAAPSPGTGRSSPRGGPHASAEKIQRTVYVSDLSQDLTEAAISAAFLSCGSIVDCRICGDTQGPLRFAFIEFCSVEAAQKAVSRSGQLVGNCIVRVSPSKTAIVPVSNTYLPRSSSEWEQVARTVYVTNVDRRLEREALRTFFSEACGPVSRLRLLGDGHHATKIAFVEFFSRSSAHQALTCSGTMLGGSPLRVSPSKTPLRTGSGSSRSGRSSLS